jgi:hypothetical protein
MKNKPTSISKFKRITDAEFEALMQRRTRLAVATIVVATIIVLGIVILPGEWPPIAKAFVSVGVAVATIMTLGCTIDDPQLRVLSGKQLQALVTKVRSKPDYNQIERLLWDWMADGNAIRVRDKEHIEQRLAAVATAEDKALLTKLTNEAIKRKEGRK